MKPLALIRNAIRGKEILAVLARHGFSDLLDRVNAPTEWIPKLARSDTRHHGMPIPTRIRKVCEDLGPTFVKIGQVLSTRPDIIPHALVEELKLLRDRVRQQDFALFTNVLDEELGCKWHEHFSSIGNDPIGSASLAQVYKGTLKSTGQRVAIKIQRPHIQNVLKADLEILLWLAREANDLIDDLRPLQLPEVVEALREGLLKELDFRNEAENIKTFNLSNPYSDKVFAPLVHESLTHKRLLVMDYVEGFSPDKGQWDAERRKEFAQWGGNSVFHQIIIQGFFHADPHPGNILITDDNRLCLLDWGMAGQLPRSMRHILADLLDALRKQDAVKVVRVARRLNRRSIPIDEQQLEASLSSLMLRHHEALEIGNFGELMFEIAYTLGQSGLPLGRDFTLLIKAVVSIEESGTALDPDFNIGELAKPFLHELWQKRYRMDQLAESIWMESKDIGLALAELPRDLRRILSRIEREEIEIKLRHGQLESLARPLNHALNRVVLGLIIGSLIIGSSMIMTSGAGPSIFGYPKLGLFGYLLSAVLGLWVIFDILRNSGHK